MSACTPCATGAPVSADLEDGCGAKPEACAETVQLAAEAGLCGCTIEDTTADPANPIHGFEHPVARIRAAGVRRISVGGVLARATYGQLLAPARLLVGGDLPGVLRDVPPHAAIEAMMQP